MLIVTCDPIDHVVDRHGDFDGRHHYPDYPERDAGMLGCATAKLLCFLRLLTCERPRVFVLAASGSVQSIVCNNYAGLTWAGLGVTLGALLLELQPRMRA